MDVDTLRTMEVLSMSTCAVLPPNADFVLGRFQSTKFSLLQGWAPAPLRRPAPADWISLEDFSREAICLHLQQTWHIDLQAVNHPIPLVLASNVRRHAAIGAGRNTHTP